MGTGPSQQRALRMRQGAGKQSLGRDRRWWQARADECRAVADTFSNPETRAKMYALAEDYERRGEAAQLLEPTPDRVPAT